MEMYRYETQYHDVTVDRGLDPRKIPHYPINDFMQSVAGRNLAGAAWDKIAAMQAQGAQAMQRDQQIREVSVATGVPEVHLHAAVPQGYSAPQYFSIATPRPPALAPAPDAPAPEGRSVRMRPRCRCRYWCRYWRG